MKGVASLARFFCCLIAFFSCGVRCGFFLFSFVVDEKWFTPVDRRYRGVPSLCDRAQGFFLARPAPPDLVAAWLDRDAPYPEHLDKMSEIASLEASRHLRVVANE